MHRTSQGPHHTGPRCQSRANKANRTPPRGRSNGTPAALCPRPHFGSGETFSLSHAGGGSHQLLRFGDCESLQGPGRERSPKMRKKLIEVALPLEAINVASAREK